MKIHEYISMEKRSAKHQNMEYLRLNVQNRSDKKVTDSRLWCMHSKNKTISSFLFQKVNRKIESTCVCARENQFWKNPKWNQMHTHTHARVHAVSDEFLWVVNSVLVLAVERRGDLGEWCVLTFCRAHKAVNGHLEDCHLHCPRGVGIWSIFFGFSYWCVCFVCVCVVYKNVMCDQWNCPKRVGVWCTGLFISCNFCFGYDLGFCGWIFKQIIEKKKHIVLRKWKEKKTIYVNKTSMINKHI